MPTLAGRRVFKLSRFGFGVYDVQYDDDNGANMSTLRPPPGKDLTEMCAHALASADRTSSISWNGCPPNHHIAPPSPTCVSYRDDDEFERQLDSRQHAKGNNPHRNSHHG